MFPCSSWLATLARGGERILPFFLEGRYVNVNSRDDLNYANFLVRELNFDRRRTSLVYVIDENDEEAAAGPVARFASRLCLWCRPRLSPPLFAVRRTT